jgi:hypothetical protein
MIAGTPLERRYRRLLAWYPPKHRAAYGEDMIGVLLAAAPDGQSRPGLADIADLIKGGLLARLRQGRHDGLDVGWRDTLAIASIAIPMMLALSWAGGVAIWTPSIRSRIPDPVIPAGLERTLIAISLVVCAVSILLAVLLPVAALRYRRTAALICVGAAPCYAFFLPFQDRQSYSMAFILEAIALIFSSGPRRVMQLLARKQWIALGSAGLALSVPRCLLAFPFVTSPPSPRMAVWAIIAAVTGLGLMLMLPSPVGRRLVVMLGMPTYASVVLLTTTPTGQEATFVFLTTLAVALLAATLAWRSRRSGESAHAR